MANNIIPIDINQINQEILELENKISDLTKEREFRIHLREYAISRFASNNRNSANHQERKIEEEADGINFFLFSILKGRKVEKAEIVNAWAEKTGKSRDDVYNTVSNALTRGKTDKKFENEIDPRGRRFGSKWFIKQKG
ncbi:MAG TPA: hypothetical protein VG890_03370 [Puia sp.]|nr:hypothetical protein [Puia sp.]